MYQTLLLTIGTVNKDLNKYLEGQMDSMIKMAQECHLSNFPAEVHGGSKIIGTEMKLVLEKLANLWSDLGSARDNNEKLDYDLLQKNVLEIRDLLQN